MHNHAQVDVLFPPHRVIQWRKRKYSARVLPGREEMIEGEQHRVEQGCPSTQPLDSRQQEASKVELLHNRTDKSIEEKAQDSGSNQEKS